MAVTHTAGGLNPTMATQTYLLLRESYSVELDISLEELMRLAGKRSHHHLFCYQLGVYQRQQSTGFVWVGDCSYTQTSTAGLAADLMATTIWTYLRPTLSGLGQTAPMSTRQKLASELSLGGALTSLRPS